jgi:hypothetical protein
MINQHQFTKIALAFPEVEELPHFEKRSFRVKKKIFATLNMPFQRACVKLSEIDQSVFSSIGDNILYPVPNKWGKQGWTNIDLTKIELEMLEDVLKTAYIEVAPKKLSDNV